MPNLEIGGHSFECRPNLPQWRLMELAAAVRSNDPMAQMAGMHAFVLAVIKPDERDRFVETMHALDDADDVDTLDEAIGTLMEQYAAPAQGAASARPTRRSSVSASGLTSTTGTSKGAPSPPATPRVVNLSSRAGHSAAS